MKILLIHPNMPGQYKHLAKALGADPDNQVVFITKPKNITIPGVTKVEYRVSRDVTPETHRYLIGTERAVHQGQEVWRVCKKLKESGFTPDVVCAHPGWGDALFIKDIFPESRLLNFLEFYYHAFGADVHFDKNEPVIMDDLARIRIKNITNLLNLEACDWGIAPTYWQFIQNPKEFHAKISIIHDGIDTDAAAPGGSENLLLPNGVKLSRKDEVVTYVCRNFEPYRGFPTVMRAIEIITRERPNCHVLIVGNDGVSYGKAAEGKKTYKQQMLEEVKLDLNRVHFIETLGYADYLKVLQFSGAHIYYTVPFVLSWSSMEALSAGCLVVGSDTAPVREVIKDGFNGLLADFFSPEDLARRVNEVFEHPDRMQAIRRAARQSILDNYSLHKLLPLHIALIKDLAAGHTPPPAAERIRAEHSALIDISRVRNDA